MNTGFILARRVSEIQQLNCKHSVCPYPRKGIHVSCLMTPSQAPFIALSILGNVLFMPQSKFIDSLLDQCVATLSTHGLCAVIQADSKPPFPSKKSRCIGSMLYEPCAWKRSRCRLSQCLSRHRNQISPVGFSFTKICSDVQPTETWANVPVICVTTRTIPVTLCQIYHKKMSIILTHSWNIKKKKTE